jgi:hypothetical protein
MLFYHCEFAKFIDSHQSNRPFGIVANSFSGSEIKSSNCLLSFICIENWDNESMIDECINIISTHLNMIKRRNIIIIPFAHLSHFLADSSKAVPLLELIVQGLKKNKFEVEISSFGYHKSLKCILSEFSIYGHQGSVAFRQIPNNLESEFLNIVHSIGIEKAQELIIKIKNNEVN